MLLRGVKKENGWLRSEWSLTYGIGWDGICKAAKCVYHDLNNPELLINSEPAEIKEEEDILIIEESLNLTIRGMSKTLHVPIMITFYNQLTLVRVTVACANEEFSEADYRNFNLSMGQYMDSVELNMFA